MNPMARALELGKSALGTTSPNPAVGAVIVKDGSIVGEGYTQPPGGDHAEIVAIRQAAALAQGADLYVTLEPCAHQGRTPPCVDAINRAGITRVFIGTVDPAPHTDGKGIDTLMRLGIHASLDSDPSEFKKLIEAFAKHARTGIPFVTAKFAMSLDGKIATSVGDSRWISNATSRLIVHHMRAQSDAVMVGIGTVLADDPQLTVRDIERTSARQPIRVIADSMGRLPPNARLLREPGATILATGSIEPALGTVSADSVEVVRLPNGAGRVDLHALLEELGNRGVTSVLVEGGSELIGALFDLGMIDKIVAFIAPILIGGRDAASPMGGYGKTAIEDAGKLVDVRHEYIEGDLLVTGYVQPRMA